MSNRRKALADTMFCYVSGFLPSPSWSAEPIKDWPMQQVIILLCFFLARNSADSLERPSSRSRKSMGRRQSKDTILSGVEKIISSAAFTKQDGREHGYEGFQHCLTLRNLTLPKYFAYFMLHAYCPKWFTWRTYWYNAVFFIESFIGFFQAD